MTKLFEYRESMNTEAPVSFCWKVLVTLFTASVFLVMAMACNSCQSDEINADIVEEGEPATLRLEVAAEEEMNIATRTVDDSKINNLHVLVYNRQGELIGQKYQTGSPTVTVNTVVATGCTVYAIANTGNASLFSGYAIHEEEDFKKMSRTVSSWNAFTAGADLPMTGSCKVDIESSTTLTTPLALTRMVAKVTLTIEIEPNRGIIVNNYSLCNLPKKGYYVPRPTKTEGDILDTDNTDVGDDAPSTDVDYWVDGSAVAVSNNAVKTTFYMFENRRGVNLGITTQDKKGGKNVPDNATYVKITGTEKGLPVNWKVYLGANNTTNFNIKRNCVYDYNIKLKAAGTTDSRVTFEPVNYINLSEKENANCYLASADNQWYRFDATVRGNGETQDYANLQYYNTYPGVSLMPSVISGNTSAVTIPKTEVKDAIVVWETSIGLVNWLTWDKDLGCVKFMTGTAKGNAVIAVRDASNKILWSWHIWRTDGVDLDNLNSNHVMEITTNTERQWYENIMGAGTGKRRPITMMQCNLGAQMDDDCSYNKPNGNIGIYSLLYQFGRKDPFPGAASYTGDAEVSMYGYGSSDDYNTTGFTVFDKKQPSTICETSAQAALDYTIEHPEVFIYGLIDQSAYNWIHNAVPNTLPWAISRCLWGDNSSTAKLVNEGELDPDPWGTTKENGKKTIYDPCPAGWRVAATDSWTGLAADNWAGGAVDKKWCVLATDAAIIKDDVEKGFKLYFGSKTSGVSTYLYFAGLRNGVSGKIFGGGVQGNFWGSSPSGTNTSVATSFCGTSTMLYLTSDANMSFGIPVRCCKIQ